MRIALVIQETSLVEFPLAREQTTTSKSMKTMLAALNIIRREKKSSSVCILYVSTIFKI